MATKVILVDYPAGVNYEYSPYGNYVWSSVNDFTVIMPDSHAQQLQSLPTAEQFKFVAIDPNAPDPQAQALAFSKLKPGKDTPAATGPLVMPAEGEVSNG